MKSVFVMWQDLTGTRMWHPVAKLTQKSEQSYIFEYTKGSLQKNFVSFPNMENKSTFYQSENLFTFFRNRLIPESRPEHNNMFEWSGLSVESKDYLELLAVSGGVKKTDHFRIVDIPVKQNNFYRVKFFVSRINYLTSDERNNFRHLVEGERLNFEFDEVNTVDDDATILLREANTKVGYLPHYLCRDLKKLLLLNAKNEIEATVLKVNHNAPVQFKLLCKLKAPWKDEFEPFSDSEFESYT
jgi:hypothetical protein